MVLVTDKERFSGIVVFLTGHHSSMELLVLYCFTLNYSFITEALDEGKVKHISFEK